ncbi:hypothetical protein BJ912DRAFT_921467 [Pholiota molesta]|nr:hypothetical protein BJ912DRAFT_921467 [Pholiota molesta]
MSTISTTTSTLGISLNGQGYPKLDQITWSAGVPLSPSTITEYAAVILGDSVSTKWVYGFQKHHPDLVVRWTTGLESCHVTEFFEILKDLTEKYHIKPHNIYNMDEKGLQLGVGKRARVLVDRDQKSVQQLENGNRK